MRRTLRLTTSAASAIAVLAAAATAQASVTVGQANSSGFTCSLDGYTHLQDAVASAPTYAVPAGAHTIKVVREGFKSVSEKVQVDAGNTVPKRYTLLPGG